MKNILNRILIMIMLVSAGVYAQPHAIPAITLTTSVVDLPSGSWMGSVAGDTNIGSLAATVGQINMAAPNGVYIAKVAGYSNGNLAVDGTVLAQRVKIAAVGGANWSWADYVFADNYKLKPLAQVALFIQENKHLEGMPTTAEVNRDGIDMAPITAKMLEKIEELTLYVIELNKKNEEQKQEIELFKSKIETILIKIH